MAPDALPLFPLPDGPAGLVGFRYSSYDIPFWVRPNTRAGRWNREGDDPTQYWSLTAEGAWAELIRHEDLRSERELDLVRMSIWTCRVPCAMLADLRDPALQVEHGVTEEQLVADDWAACQDLSVRLRPLVRGVIAPSAALPGHDSLTLFGPRRPIDWRTAPALASAIPTARIAIGRPPSGLVDRVRRRQASQEGRLF